MLKALAAIDGSKHADQAVHYLIKLHRTAGNVEIHLINVQIPIVSGHARMFVGKADLEGYYKDESEHALKGARSLLQQAGAPFTEHVAVGHVADSIVKFAHDFNMDQIVMGTHGRSALTDLLLGSVVADVIRKADVPVVLVK